VTDASALAKQALTSIFPGYAAPHAFLNLDAGLIRLDDVSQWTSQVYGIGEIGEIFDATETTISLDLIGSPVRAFGGVSTVELRSFQESETSSTCRSAAFAPAMTLDDMAASSAFTVP